MAGRRHVQHIHCAGAVEDGDGDEYLIVYEVCTKDQKLGLEFPALKAAIQRAVAEIFSTKKGLAELKRRGNKFDWGNLDKNPEQDSLLQELLETEGILYMKCVYTGYGYPVSMNERII